MTLSQIPPHIPFPLVRCSKARAHSLSASPLCRFLCAHLPLTPLSKPKIIHSHNQLLSIHFARDNTKARRLTNTSQHIIYYQTGMCNVYVLASFFSREAVSPTARWSLHAGERTLLAPFRWASFSAKQDLNACLCISSTAKYHVANL